MGPEKAERGDIESRVLLSGLHRLALRPRQPTPGKRALVHYRTTQLHRREFPGGDVGPPQTREGGGEAEPTS